eukprot:2638150-Prorocentrum_lima.AAC.1
MTSSLVGSEMCIRDSIRHPAADAAQQVLAEFSGTISMSTWRMSNPPVSYTHLTLPTICSV